MNLMAPPTGMTVCNENIQSNALLDFFIEQFEERFGTKPIFQGDYHIQIFKDLNQSCGTKSFDVIRHFFAMKDDWYMKQGYSPACLKSALPAITISLAKRENVVPKQGMRIATKIICDTCFKHFDLECDPNWLDKRPKTICLDCRGV